MSFLLIYKVVIFMIQNFFFRKNKTCLGVLCVYSKSIKLNFSKKKKGVLN